MKKILLLTFLFILAVAGPSFAMCVSGNCLDGEGTMTWADGARYEGRFQYGVRHGFGTMTGPDSTRYVGEYRDDKKDGYGVLIFADGKIYRGQFAEGLPDGFGTFTFPDGTEYTGQYRAGNKHGLGRRTYADGTVYEGGYRDDMKDGYGRMIFQEGKMYEGLFAEGLPDGYGIFTSKDGASYRGSFKAGRKHGQGTYTFADGTVYEGEYRDDKRHGKGTSYYSDGTVYQGEYRNDMKHGQGSIISSDGKTYKGQFINGRPEGPGVLTFADGVKYVGEFKDGKKHGRGELVYPDGRRTSTTWQDSRIVEEPMESGYKDNMEAVVLQKKEGEIPGKYPEASGRTLTIADLQNLTEAELNIMRNEIFARHSYRFRTQAMQRHFAAQPWYTPQYDNVDAMLSRLEVANVNTILTHRKERKQRKMTAGHKQADTESRMQAEDVVDEKQDGKNAGQPARLASGTTVQVAGDNTDIRSGPGTGTRIQWQEKKGSELRVLKQKGAWLSIEDSSGRKGWIRREIVRPAPD